MSSSDDDFVPYVPSRVIPRPPVVAAALVAPSPAAPAPPPVVVASPLIEVFDGINKSRLDVLLAKSDQDFSSFLTDCGLLPLARSCPGCSAKMRRAIDKAHWTGFRFACTSCAKTCSSLKDTWFGKSCLNPRDILKITYFHSWDDEYRRIQHESRRADGSTLSDNTIADWLNYMREVETKSVVENSAQIGGPGIIVELDESVFGKRKYHKRKRVAENWWIFGGVERGNTRKCFMEYVEKRDKETLHSLIMKHVAYGSHIITDGWPAYNGLDQLGYGYVHDTVNHSLFFKDPQTGACTNSIEGLWQKLKAPHKARYGTHREYLISHIDSWVFKNRYPQESRMYQILLCIRDQYTPK